VGGPPAAVDELGALGRVACGIVKSAAGWLVLVAGVVAGVVVAGAAATVVAATVTAAGAVGGVAGAATTGRTVAGVACEDAGFVFEESVSGVTSGTVLGAVTVFASCRVASTTPRTTATTESTAMAMISGRSLLTIVAGAGVSDQLGCWGFWGP